MNVKENQYMGPWMNAPGTMLPWDNMPGVEKCPYYRPGMPPMIAGAMAYPTVYPEIYYKIQPHIMRVCDEMDMYEVMPSEEMIEHKCDQIYDDVCRIHPDLAEYAREYEKQADNPSDPPEELGSHNPDGLGSHNPDGLGFGPGLGFGFGFGGRRRFRRRGLFRDLIRILLLSELFGRRRRRRRFF